VVDPALNRSVKFGEGDGSGAILIPARSQAAREFDDVAGLDAAMGGIDDEAKPGNAVRTGNDLGLRFVDGQTQAAQEIDDGALPFIEPALAVIEKRKIIDIAQIGLASQVLRDEVVERRQIDVAPELAGQVADRQTARAFDSEEIVTGKVDHLILVRQHALTAADDPLDQPSHRVLRDRLKEQITHDGVIDGRKMLDDIDAQDVAVTPGEELQPVDGFVSPFADPVRVGVGDEPAFKDWLYHVAEGVMDDAISEWRGADSALLRIVDHEVDVAAGPIAEVGQFTL